MLVGVAVSLPDTFTCSRRSLAVILDFSDRRRQDSDTVSRAAGREFSSTTSTVSTAAEGVGVDLVPQGAVFRTFAMVLGTPQLKIAEDFEAVSLGARVAEPAKSDSYFGALRPLAHAGFRQRSAAGSWRAPPVATHIGDPAISRPVA